MLKVTCDVSLTSKTMSPGSLPPGSLIRVRKPARKRALMSFYTRGSDLPRPDGTEKGSSLPIRLRSSLKSMGSGLQSSSTTKQYQTRGYSRACREYLMVALMLLCVVATTKS